MPWKLLRFQTSPPAIEEIEQLLLASGAQSVTLLDAEDQPVFQTSPDETPLWDKIVMCGMFDDQADLEPLLQKLKAYTTAAGESAYQVETLDDQDWEKSWMDRYRPLQFGERLWICPSWLTPPDPGAVNLMLDPGLAFGTGTHPTTALCLEWLEQQDLQDRLVIDYGCGSGVLGIAAALLGAKQVLAVDNDPQAIMATEANRDANGLSAEQLSCYLPEALPFTAPFLPADVLVANILAGPLEQLAGTFAELLKSGGNLVLSGILPEQAATLQDACHPWFTLKEIDTRDGWARLSGSRR